MDVRPGTIGHPFGIDYFSFPCKVDTAAVRIKMGINTTYKWGLFRCAPDIVRSFHYIKPVAASKIPAGKVKLAAVTGKNGVKFIFLS